MTFTIKPTGENLEWLKKNTEKDALMGEIAALDRWTTEGGFTANEGKATPKKMRFVYRKREQASIQRHNRGLLQ